MFDGMNRIRHHLTGFVQSGLLFALLLAISYKAAVLVFGVPGAVLVLLGLGAVTFWTLGNRRVVLPAGTHRIAYADAPEFVDRVRALSDRAGLNQTPELYVVPNPQANAATLGVGKEATILITTGLTARLDLRGLTGVLAHEIAHAKNGDLILFAFADAFRSAGRLASFFLAMMVFFAFPILLFGGTSIPAGSFLFLVAAPFLALLVQLALMRIREYQADLTAAELTGDPEGLADALAQIDRPVRRWSDWFLPAQRRPESVFGGLLRSHPDTRERIRRLRSMAAHRSPS